MKKLLSAAAVAGLGLLALPAQAQFAKPEDAVKYRQSAFFLMGQQMGRINGQLKADKPNLQTIQTAAGVLNSIDALPYEGFTPGTEQVKTRAKPEAYKDTAKVKEMADKMMAEVTKLDAAAKGGDLAAIRAQFGAVGQSGKACHDQYRTD
jgi:cytochrome c556